MPKAPKGHAKKKAGSRKKCYSSSDRPLNCYNLFYRLERALYLQGIGKFPDNLTSKLANFDDYRDIVNSFPLRPERYAHLVLQDDWFMHGKSKPTQEKGSITMVDMTTTMAKNWENADPCIRRYVKEVSCAVKKRRDELRCGLAVSPSLSVEEEESPMKDSFAASLGGGLRPDIAPSTTGVESTSWMQEWMLAKAAQLFQSWHLNSTHQGDFAPFSNGSTTTPWNGTTSNNHVAMYASSAFSAQPVLQPTYHRQGSLPTSTRDQAQFSSSLQRRHSDFQPSRDATDFSQPFRYPDVADHSGIDAGMLNGMSANAASMQGSQPKDSFITSPMAGLAMLGSENNNFGAQTFLQPSMNSNDAGLRLNDRSYSLPTSTHGRAQVSNAAQSFQTWHPTATLQGDFAPFHNVSTTTNGNSQACSEMTSNNHGVILDGNEYYHRRGSLPTSSCDQAQYSCSLQRRHSDVQPFLEATDSLQPFCHPDIAGNRCDEAGMLNGFSAIVASRDGMNDEARPSLDNNDGRPSLFSFAAQEAPDQNIQVDVSLEDFAGVNAWAQQMLANNHLLLQESDQESESPQDTANEENECSMKKIKEVDMTNGEIIKLYKSS